VIDGHSTINVASLNQGWGAGVGAPRAAWFGRSHLIFSSGAGARKKLEWSRGWSRSWHKLVRLKASAVFKNFVKSNDFLYYLAG